MLNFNTEQFSRPSFHHNESYFPLKPQGFPFQSGTFISTDCSSLSSIDGVFSSNTSEKDSPIGKNFVDQTNYRVKYKTEICKYWREKGFCEFGDNCAFAHGYHEIREKVHVPSNYKTKKCKKFHENGYCPYGCRCQFLHYTNQKSQVKNKRISNVKVNSYWEFICNSQEFWNRDEKRFNWLYQCRRRLEAFTEVAEKKETYENLIDFLNI